MKTVIGKVYKFSDLESLKSLDPVSVEDVEELQKVVKPILDNAEEMGISQEDVRKIKNFIVRIKQRTISTQEGEQRDYEHVDLQYPENMDPLSSKGPSGRTEQENSMSGVSATPGA